MRNESAILGIAVNLLTEIALQAFHLCDLVQPNKRGVANGAECVIEHLNWSRHVTDYARRDGCRKTEGNLQKN